MRNLVIVLSILITGAITAQNTISKTVGEFSELKVYDLINVELIESTENKIEITGKNTKDVLVVQKNNTLKIKMVIKVLFIVSTTSRPSLEKVI